ncbi:hypothetical protein ACSSS7_006273 [Eimeria intestinalis]
MPEGPAPSSASVMTGGEGAPLGPPPATLVGPVFSFYDEKTCPGPPEASSVCTHRSVAGYILCIDVFIPIHFFVYDSNRASFTYPAPSSNSSSSNNNNNSKRSNSSKRNSSSNSTNSSTNRGSRK